MSASIQGEDTRAINSNRLQRCYNSHKPGECLSTSAGWEKLLLAEQSTFRHTCTHAKNPTPSVFTAASLLNTEDHEMARPDSWLCTRKERQNKTGGKFPVCLVCLPKPRRTFQMVMALNFGVSNSGKLCLSAHPALIASPRPDVVPMGAQSMLSGTPTRTGCFAWKKV